MLTETQVRNLLGIPDDNRVTFETDWDGSAFVDTECYEGDCRHGDGVTASVHIDWTRPGYDADTDAPNSLTLVEEAYCMAHAKAALAEILDDTAPFAHEPEVFVKVVVNGWYLRYAPIQAVAA
ncbi:hypothetical protein [Nocardia ignorata]|uniref:Uncharacterized protein n=1 Tax=Nocardia ignorata TaxID=145285 RepID=A0A4R6P3F3_NOCIG|nr:hypothetical protein [Nocardia ignorata]TDP29831.1 hypothetical protein DFR75_11299 [Nocardia ignorata]